MGRLNERQINKELRRARGWKRSGAEIRKTVRRADFVRTMAFVNAVALLAERASHHPDIDIRWNTVSLTLSTHSAGGLTQKDFDLARAINAL